MSTKRIIMLVLFGSAPIMSFSQTVDYAYLRFKYRTQIPFYYSAPNVVDAVDSCSICDDTLFCFINFKDTVRIVSDDNKSTSVYVDRYYIDKRKYTLPFPLDKLKSPMIEQFPKYIIINNTYGIWFFQLSEKKVRKYYVLEKFQPL